VSTSKSGRRSLSAGKRLDWILLAPGLAWFSIFLLAPVGFIIVISFFGFTPGGYIPGFTLEHYARVITDPSSQTLLLFSVRLSLTVTALSLLIGYPVAYFIGMKMKGMVKKTLFLLLFLTPFWVEYSTRTVAWLPVLGQGGILNRVLMGVGIISEPSALFLFSEFSVTMVMVLGYFLFMIFPIVFAMLEMDPTLLEQAEVLGASRWKAFYHVTFKVSLPGVVVGCIFVFVISMADFATPRVLGGAVMTMPQVVVMQTTSAANFPLASAYATILVVVTMVVVMLLLRVADVRRLIY